MHFAILFAVLPGFKKAVAPKFINALIAFERNKVMRKIALILYAVLLCVASRAWAQEDGVVAAASAASQGEEETITRPTYMLPPDGLRYEGDLRANKAKAGGLLGVIGGGAVLALGAIGMGIGISDWIFGVNATDFGGLISGSLALIGSIVLAPISFSLSNKSSIWKYYKRHRLIDALGWTFYGLSIAAAIPPAIMGLFIMDADASGYYGIVFGSTALAGAVALALFGAKGLWIHKMARHAEAHNSAASTSADTYQKKVTILPSARPLVSGRKNLSGVTWGIAGTF